MRKSTWGWWCGVAVTGFVVSGVPVGAAVVSVPGPPFITSVTAGVQNATVAFIAPVDDGGATVFAYTATCSTADGSLRGARSGNVSPLRVGGLAPGKSYACRVAARNIVGLGALSGVSGPVVPLLGVGRSKPGAPTNVHAIAEIESVRLDFTLAPDPRGSRKVVQFRGKCTSSDGGVSAVRRVNRRALIVGPLTAGKTYTCVVRDESKNGFGPYSAPSNAVVPLAPLPALGAATITSVTAGVGRLIISFTQPAHDGGQPILHYRVTCVSTDGGTPNVRTGVASPIVVLGLSTAKTYTCEVIAHNRQGNGPPSTPSAPVVTLAN